ncbi:MAG: hypothetical protein C0625_02150 [Arcobacter sp.]|nr:MAG: hypothetical protein C0625_02150 [Arcobacter sp.]
MARKAKVIKFEEPIIVGGKEIKEVSMRVPKGKDLKAVSHIVDTHERDMTMVSNLCDLNATMNDFDEMDGKELQQLKKELIVFLT